MDVNPPDVLRAPLSVPYKLLMGPGPSNCPPETLRALGRPILGHLHTETLKIMDDVKEGIRYAFQTRNELTLAISASGHAGMETIFSNLAEKGETVLITSSGYWGPRAADIAGRYGLQVEVLVRAPGSSVALHEFEAALKKHRPKLLFVVQGDTSTGVHQPLEGLGHLCHSLNCLLAVDTVASLGSVPLFADRWDIDAVYTGSQKALSAPPGITPISFSDRAKKAILARKTKIPVYYFDMLLLGQYWGCFPDKPRIYHHTISSTLLCGLREALANFAREGYENVIKRHSDSAKLLYAGLDSLGFDFYVANELERIPTVTTIVLPRNLEEKSLIEYCMKNYGVEISGGLGPTAGKALRIGLMGVNATPDHVKILLRILRKAAESASQSRL